jgi:hypothetical protein
MWATGVVAAIALAAAAFMLTFLIALLREGAPSLCYWVVPVRREPKRELVEILSSNCMDDGGWAISQPPAALPTRDRFPAVRPLRKTLRKTTRTPGNRIFVRLRIEPPRQS